MQAKSSDASDEKRQGGGNLLMKSVAAAAAKHSHSFPSPCRTVISTGEQSLISDNKPQILWLIGRKILYLQKTGYTNVYL